MSEGDEPDIDTGKISFADDPSKDELRDYFAGQVLPEVARQSYEENGSNRDVAEICYDFADAMLEQRGGE